MPKQPKWVHRLNGARIFKNTTSFCFAKTSAQYRHWPSSSNAFGGLGPFWGSPKAPRGHGLYEASSPKCLLVARGLLLKGSRGQATPTRGHVLHQFEIVDFWGVLGPRWLGRNPVRNRRFWRGVLGPRSESFSKSTMFGRFWGPASWV